MLRASPGSCLGGHPEPGHFAPLRLDPPTPCAIQPDLIQAYRCLNGEPHGQVAEWLRTGLQSRVHRFESGPGLHFLKRRDKQFDRHTLGRFSDTDQGWIPLSGANLSHANLQGATLLGANLAGANLSGAKLFPIEVRDKSGKTTGRMR